MEVAGEDEAPTVLELHTGLHSDHCPMQSHRPDVLFLPDAGLAGGQLLDAFNADVVAVLLHIFGNDLELLAQRVVLRSNACDELIDRGLVVALGCHVLSLSWVVGRVLAVENYFFSYSD